MSIRKSMLGFFLIFALFLLFGGAALQECEADQAAGTSPVYRFYNTQTGTHFFTISEAEKDYVIVTYPQFTFEGIAWYAYPPGPTPTPTGSAQWGVLNLVGCADGSSLTFSVKIDGTTKISTTHGLESTPSWAGYASTSSGTKNFSWSLSGCGNASGSGSAALGTDKCYVFLAIWDDPNVVVAWVENPGCGDPRSSTSSFEENVDAMDLEELEVITLQEGSDYDELGIIEKIKIDSP